MKCYNKSYLLFLLVISVLSGCVEAENEEQIDRQYLESGEYKSFAEDVRLESERRKDTGIQSRLMLLPECADVPDQTLPLTIDENELENLLSGGVECPGLESRTDTETEIRLIGRLSGSNPETWLVLLEPFSVYKKREIAVVTASDGELSAFEKVALYQEDLTREITTELAIEQNGEIHITAVSHRIISYPIKQENTEKVRFIIRSDGSIEKESSLSH